jgi:tetratricopeptide (TPR) repeat protein
MKTAAFERSMQCPKEQAYRPATCFRHSPVARLSISLALMRHFGPNVAIEQRDRSMRGSFYLALISLGTCGPLNGTAFAQQTGPAPSVASTLTIQQQFDAGTVATDAGEWEKALAVYAALETRLLQGKPKERSVAIVRLRKGTALFRLRRTDESEAAILAAMDKLPADDASLREDRSKGFYALGDIAERRYDYAQAAAQFQASLEIADFTHSKANALNRMIATGIFVDPMRALANADSLIALLTSEAMVNPEWKGTAHNLRGQALLNLGRTAEAAAEFDTAIKLLGGLRFGSVNLFDTAARSNAAIAAMRLGNTEKARKYLSYAGAVMQSNQGFALGKDMSPPECGGLNGPKPEDVAVIELQINNDGSVNYARPIYFSGKPSVALEFGRAVSKWSWSKEELKSVDAFFRAQTRIEMRCTTVFNRPGTADLLTPAFDRWLVAKSVTNSSGLDIPDAKALGLRRTELMRLEAAHGTNAAELIPSLLSLSFNTLVKEEERKRLTDRALAIAKGAGAPPPVVAYFELASAYMLDSQNNWDGSKFARRISMVLTEPAIASDSLASGVLSLSLYDALPSGERKRRGAALLTTISGDKSRAPNDPIRVGALIRLATLEHETGRIEAARAAFEESGLSSQQCALVDASQRKTKGTIGDSAYPASALQFGFSGWTVVEFDIAADGTTLNQRPLISFPPFIFGDSTVEQIKRFRYEQAYRPAGGLGCGGQRQRVSYRRGF